MAGFADIPKNIIFNLLLQGIVLFFGIMVTKHMMDVGKVSDQNTTTVTAVVNDWNTLPFTKVEITDNKCHAGTETMFVREWGGTEEGCVINH